MRNTKEIMRKENVIMNTTHNHPYVDKTMMIQEYLDKKDRVACITRPDHFGKTTNFQMLSFFLDNTYDVTEKYQNSYIAQTSYWRQRNQFPVLSLTFQNAKCDTLELCLYYIKKAIELEVERHQTMLGRTLKTSAYLKHIPKDTNVLETLTKLSEELYTIYHRPVHILFNDYDIPVRYAKRYGFTDALWKNFNYRSLIESDNTSLIASVLLLGTECLFEDNEISTYTCMENGYATAFGYTEEEVQNLFRHANLSWTSAIKEMYGGFLIGNQSMYSPYAINAYLTSGKRIIHTNYRNTSKHLLEWLKTIDREALSLLQALENTKSILLPSQNIFDSHSPWKRLLAYGYINITQRRNTHYSIQITNKETEEEILYMIKKLKESS